MLHTKTAPNLNFAPKEIPILTIFTLAKITKIALLTKFQSQCVTQAKEVSDFSEGTTTKILTRWNAMRFHVHWHRDFELDYSPSIHGWQKRLRKSDSHLDFVDNLERFLCTNRDLNRWQNHQMSTWLAEDGARFQPFLKKKVEKKLYSNSW